MKSFLTVVMFIFSFKTSAACMTPDYELKGVTKDGKKCELVLNLDEKYMSFETPKQSCYFEIDEEEILDLRDPKKSQVTAKGYSNWFDCKVKLFYNEKGQPYKAKLHSRLTMAMTFSFEECLFEAHQ
jgi:hypothetical protein